jgi:hypothetical protein
LDFDELFADPAFLAEAGAEPRPNPAAPGKGERLTYLLTFDWGIGDTDGMLDKLREAGFWADADARYPRTSIIVRTATTVPDKRVRGIVQGNLEPNGSAMLLQVGGGVVWIWPEKPWPDADEKSWRTVEG